MYSSIKLGMLKFVCISLHVCYDQTTCVGRPHDRGTGQPCIRMHSPTLSHYWAYCCMQTHGMVETYASASTSVLISTNAVHVVSWKLAWYCKWKEVVCTGETDVHIQHCHEPVWNMTILPVAESTNSNSNTDTIKTFAIVWVLVHLPTALSAPT